MPKSLPKSLPKCTFVTIAALAALMVLGGLDPAFARHKKHRHHVRDAAPIVRDYDGTPIIMQGFSRTRPVQDQPVEHADRPIRVPRGSSTYIPPPNPSPTVTPPTTVLPAPPAQVQTPPPITTYSDRVTNCIHSFPLQGGIGNNPSNQQAYVRQCAN